MLSSGVETQPVPLDSSMSAVVQELYSELPGSVSKELHGDCEPSGIPDVNPGTSRALSSQNRTLPLEQQRTHVERCGEENAETLDFGGELGWCGQVDSTAGASVASGILDRKAETKGMELKVFRNQGNPEEVVRHPSEGTKEDPSQHSTATEEKISPSQEELLVHSRQELLCADLPEDFRRSKGNTEITTETLLQSPEKVQGMKVSEAEMDTNEGHGHGNVSKDLSTGCSEYPEVDRIMASGEVSNTSPLVSVEPLRVMDSGLTEATCKEKECEELKPCPSSLSLLPGNSAISKVDNGKEALSRLNLVCEADDNHRHVLSHRDETHSSARGSPVSMKSAVVTELLDKRDKTSSCTSSGPDGDSRTTSLGECGLEDNSLMKGSTEKIAAPCFDDQSKNLASKEGNENPPWNPENEKGLRSSINPAQAGEDVTRHHSDCSGDSVTENTPSNCSIPGGIQRENSSSLMPNCLPAATGVKLKENDLRITSDIEGSLTTHEDKRETSAHVSHLGRHYEQGHVSSLMQDEEPEHAATGNPTVLRENIYNKDSKSLVTVMPESQMSPANEMSEPRSVTVPEFECRSESDKTQQTSNKGIPHVGEQSLDCELNELSSTDAVATSKGETECVLNQQVSLNSQDHVKLPADSLQNTSKVILETASEDFQESHFSPLEAEADTTAGTQIIPIRTDRKGISPPGCETCGTSSNNSTLDISPGILEMKKGVTGSRAEDLQHSKKKTAVFPQAISATKCQNVQSQNKSGRHCVNKNTSDGLPSACTLVESGTTILVGENPLIKCEDPFQKSDRPSQGTENSVENCVHEGSETLEGNELDRRDTEDHLQGWIREETTVDMLSNGAPDTVTCITSHTKHSEERLEGRGQDSSRDTVFCKDSISDCVPQGLNQSAHIPSPEKLLDQSPNLTSSHCENVKQAEESRAQRAAKVINCWRRNNRPHRQRNEEKAAKQTQDSEQKETITESHRHQSHDQKDMLAHSGSNHLLSCENPKIDGFKGSFESPFHCKDSTGSLVDTVYTDCCDEPVGVLDGKASAVDQDLDFPDASAATVESLVKKKSCEDKVCRSLESCEVELYRHSSTLETEADARCESSTGPLAPVNVALNSVHHEKQVNGASQRDPAVMGEGPSQESELDKRNAFEMSSRGSVSCSRQEENSFPLRSVFSERMSSQENSATDVNNAWGGATQLRNLFRLKDGEILCEGVKTFAVLPEKKEDLPGGMNSPGEGGASVCVKSDRPRVCHPDDRHLPGTLEGEAEVKSDGVQEHRGEPLGHLTCGRESEDGVPSKDGGGDDTSKISHTRFKGGGMVGFAEKQHSQALDNLLQKQVRHKLQKRASAVLEQCPSPDSLSDEVPKKSPSKDEEHEPTVRKKTPLAKLTRGDTTSGSQKLKDRKVESIYHPLKKDLELSPGPSLPDALQKAQDPRSAGCNELRGAFGKASHRKQVLPLKKQPPRTCKRTSSYQDQAKVGRKLGKIRTTTLLKSSLESIPTKEPRLLHSSSMPPPAQVASEPVMPGSLTHHIPKQWAAPCHLLRKLTKESALLSKLSILARKLAPSDSKTQKLRYWRCSSELLPVAKSYKRLRYRRFLDGFSSNTMQLDPYLAGSRWNKMPGSKPVALYSLEAIKLNLVDFSHKVPSLLLGSEILPMSLDVNSGLDCMAEASVTFPEHCVPEGLALGEAPGCSAQPPKWTFSFFFSHGSSGTAPFREDTHLQSWASGQAPPAPLAPLHSSGSTALVQSRAGVSVLGLHTLLALCSPGCYRIWTKKRNFSNHMATMQRLFVTQFKQGLKGLQSPASIADKVFCSLPYSVGRVLSIWSQHGPSACPLEISALYSNHTKWQTSLVTTSRLEPPFSALVPKSCLVTETPVVKLLLSASEFQVPVFDELDGVTAVCPRPQSSSSEQKEAEPEKRPKKVSQIRIRKTIPKPDPNLTPMGLPRPKRLKKKEFSLEEIYTNKNYKSPPANRCLETIFEEPKERNGTLISISQQKRKRVLEFQDFTVPRKRRVRGKVKVAGSFTRAQKAALQSRELDALLIQKLMELETFFAKEEEQEQSSGR